MGPQNAAIMLLSDSPALEDYAAGQPIGGDAWVLAAAHAGRDRVHAGTGLQRLAVSDSTRPARALAVGNATIVPRSRRKHVRLAKPQRLLLFGDGPSLALLGKPVAQARGHVHKVEGVRTVATFHPRHLIKRPLDKSLAWQDLLLLMEDES